MPRSGDKLIWNGPAYQAAMRQAMRKRVSAACVHLSADVRATLSQSGGINLRSAGKGGKLAKRHKRVYNWSHSSPGDPPFKQTGHLRRSIAWEAVSDTVGRVGTNVKYGLYLEMGTSRMAARPYLRPRLGANRLTLARILTAQVKPNELPTLSAAGGAGSYRLGQAGSGQTKGRLKALAAQTSPLGPSTFKG